MSVDIRSVTEVAVGSPVVAAEVAARVPISYDPYLPGRAVEHAMGLAETALGDRVEWQAIVKRTEGPGLRAARRELAVYRSGLAAAGPGGGLRGPALFGFEEDDDRVEVWLELVHDAYGGSWPVERFGLAARHIAAWDARADSVDLPRGFDSEDAWAERHGQPERLAEVTAALDVARRAPRADEVMALLADDGFHRTQALIDSTPARIERLAAFDQALLHHDLIRSNLFAIGDAATVAIDWENVGRGPLGVDLAPLVIGSVRRGEASADHLQAIEAAVLDGFEDGLRDAGIEVRADVRTAYRLAIGLRWHVVLGSIRTWLDPGSWGIRGSRRSEPREEGLRHLLATARHILETADADDLA